MSITDKITDALNPYPVKMHIWHGYHCYISIRDKRDMQCSDLNDVLKQAFPDYRNIYDNNQALYIAGKDKDVVNAIVDFVEHYKHRYDTISTSETQCVFFYSVDDIAFYIQELHALFDAKSFNSYHRRKVIAEV
jgi:hypothetical protein